LETKVLPKSQGNVKAIKPTVELGISFYNPIITESDKAALEARFGGDVGVCECCGIKLKASMRHELEVKGVWYNACGMCYYPANLDEIPSFDKGKIVYFPAGSQARLNSILRACWSMHYLAKLDPDNKELMQMCESVSQIEDGILGLVQINNSYFHFSAPDVLSSTLFLLKPEEYEQRHKLLMSFRWLPEQDTFREEMAFWAQESFSSLHPEKITGNIQHFMEKYAKDYNIRD
jgi:hypothetical protein